MTTNEAHQAGADHAAKGLKVTPFDCRAIDAQLFAIVRTAQSPAKEYAKLRGAFNQGWSDKYAEMCGVGQLASQAA